MVRPDTTQLFYPTPSIPLAAGLAAIQLHELPEVGLRGIGIHAISESECVEVILSRLDQGEGGWVVTPNIDHLRRVLAEPDFRAIYDEADLRVADGMLLVWACNLQRTPVPERVAGSDLISSLSRGAARRGRSICLIGGNPGSAEKAAQTLQSRYPGLTVVGAECPPMGFEQDALAMGRLTRKLQAARPDIVFVALGSPKQERVIRQLKAELPQTWWLGVGISFSFVAGDIVRAPRWMQQVGLEWLHRFLQEPRRLFKRYFVQGLPFAAMLLARSALRGMIPKGRVASTYGRKPTVLLVDDDPFALDHLELLLTNSFAEIEITRRTTADVSGRFDFYFIDNDFDGRRAAAEMAREIRRANPHAYVYAFSGALDVDSLKRLINAGCDGVCEKGRPESWRPVLHQVKQRLDMLAREHKRKTGAFGGVRNAARSIHGLLEEWNERAKERERATGAPTTSAGVAKEDA